MQQRPDLEETYPFTWLDELAENTLNPEKNNVDALMATELAGIRERIPEEFSRISSRLKNQAFRLYSNKQVKVIAGHYDQAIRLLRQQTQINIAQCPEKGSLRETCEQLSAHLGELYQSLHQRYQNCFSEPPRDRQETQIPNKVICRLSVDQIAIILKAADDVKLVVTRSFSEVLRSIVPFLSTTRFKDVSWKSARSSTYKMEDSDKAVAISSLEALIRKIREY